MFKSLRDALERGKMFQTSTRYGSDHLPVVYDSGHGFAFLGMARDQNAADRIGKGARLEPSTRYIDGFNYAFVSIARERETQEPIGYVLH